MKIMDRLALIKAGYTAKDIKEMEKQEAEDANAKNQEGEPQKGPAEKSAENAPKADAQPDQKKAEEKPDDSADIKNAFDDLQNQLNEMKAKLTEKENIIKDIQKSNANKNLDDGKTEADKQKALEDVFRSFM